MIVSSLLLGVMLLSGPDDSVDRDMLSRVSAEADAGVREARPVVQGEKSAKITSDRSDFDREAHVVMFEGNVCVEYSTDYIMHADQLFVFLSGSNVLSRIVAVGGVAITNDTRAGSCEMAKFWNRTREIEMFGKDHPASLADESGNDLRGSKIRFWLDSEQVDVENTTIKVNKKDGDKIL